MAVRIPTSARNAAAAAVADLVDADTDPGELRIYSGTQPASANDAPSGTLLATFELEDPAFGAPSTGTVTLDTPAPTVGADDGTAGWARIVDGAGATVIDGSVTATGGGGDIEINTTTISNGLNLTVTSLTVTMPSGE